MVMRPFYKNSIQSDLLMYLKRPILRESSTTHVLSLSTFPRGAKLTKSPGGINYLVVLTPWGLIYVACKFHTVITWLTWMLGDSWLAGAQIAMRRTTIGILIYRHLPLLWKPHRFPAIRDPVGPCHTRPFTPCLSPALFSYGSGDPFLNTMSLSGRAQRGFISLLITVTRG